MPDRRTFGTLDLLRGVAALAVLALHFPQSDQRPYWSGYLAVDLFFVLSGVVVAHAYEERLRRGWPLRRFVVARIIRLWPLYLLGSAIGVAPRLQATLSYGHEAWRLKLLAIDVIRGLFLLPRPAPGIAFPFDPPAWSLSCELAINVVYAAVLVHWRARRLVLVALVGALLLVAGARHFMAVDAGLNLGGLWEHFAVGLARASFSFPVGILIHRAWMADRLPRCPIPSIVLAALFFCFLFACPGEGRWAVPAALGVILIGFPLLVTAAVQVEPSGLLHGLARVTADLSYPIYALHMPIYMVAGLAVSVAGAPAIPTYLAAIVTTLAIAPLSDRYVDRPARRRLTRLAEMPRRAVTAAAPL